MNSFKNKLTLCSRISSLALLGLMSLAASSSSGATNQSPASSAGDSSARQPAPAPSDGKIKVTPGQYLCPTGGYPIWCPRLQRKVCPDLCI